MSAAGSPSHRRAVAFAGYRIVRRHAVAAAEILRASWPNGTVIPITVPPQQRQIMAPQIDLLCA